MKNIKLITDISCDLPIDIINKYKINIVSLNISFGEETFVSGIDIDNKTFYKKMREMEELPKTACPSPERFMQAYEGEEEVVLVMTLTSKLSATYSTAVLAKDMFEQEIGNKDIRVIDTETGSIGAGLLVVEAAKLINEGKNIGEIVAEIEKLKEKLVFFGTLETLENAIKGGRINPLAGKIVNALNFKVIIQVTDGVVKPVDKARGEGNSIKKVIEKVNKNMVDTNYDTLAIGHANCIEKALRVKELMEEKYEFKNVIISEVGSAMGTYTSEGAILLSVL